LVAVVSHELIQGRLDEQNFLGLDLNIMATLGASPKADGSWILALKRICASGGHPLNKKRFLLAAIPVANV
jgi:hypothetical protein